MAGDVLDPDALARLRADVGPAAAQGMIDHFLAMLPERVERVHRAVAAGEPAELRDAALSLGCSATMLGAHGLAAACERARTGASPQALLAQIRESAAASADALSGPERA